MTREQCQFRYPDLYRFFREEPDTHPFWVEMAKVNHVSAEEGRTLLEDMEQVFSSLGQVQGRELFVEKMHQVKTRDALFALLTKLYVAYLYRNHGAALIHHADADKGFDIEVQIADQLLALGVVRFHSFDSLTEQFAAVISDEVKHLREAGAEFEDAADAAEADEKTPAEFLDELATYADDMKQHDAAHHQVLASVSNQALLPHQTKLSHHIAEHQDALRKRFPMVAGVLLVDPRPGIEKASFIPFHEGNEYLEQLLDKGV